MSIELAEQGRNQNVFKDINALLLFQIMSSLVETNVKFLKYNPTFQNDVEFKNKLFEIAWDAIKK